VGVRFLSDYSHCGRSCRQTTKQTGARPPNSSLHSHLVRSRLPLRHKPRKWCFALALEPARQVAGYQRFGGTVCRHLARSSTAGAGFRCLPRCFGSARDTTWCIGKKAKWTSGPSPISPSRNWSNSIYTRCRQRSRRPLALRYESACLSTQGKAPCVRGRV